jgi:ubiquinone biosynthesis protein UbiJ
MQINHVFIDSKDSEQTLSAIHRKCIRLLLAQPTHTGVKAARPAQLAS